MTIYGLSGKKILCENTIRCEFDLPRRTLHLSSQFPPYTQDDFSQLNDTTSTGWTRLSNAIRFNALGEVDTLLRAGADPSSGLNYAVKRGRLFTLQYLLEKGIDPDFTDENGNSPLHIAAEHERIEIVEYLLSLNCDASAKNRDGETPFSLAIRKGNLRVIIPFLKLKPRLDVTILKALANSPLSRKMVRKIREFLTPPEDESGMALEKESKARNKRSHEEDEQEETNKKQKTTHVIRPSQQFHIKHRRNPRMLSKPVKMFAKF